MTADPRAAGRPAGRRAAPWAALRATTALSETLEDEPELVRRIARLATLLDARYAPSGSWARTATWLRSRPPG